MKFKGWDWAELAGALGIKLPGLLLMTKKSNNFILSQVRRIAAIVKLWPVWKRGGSAIPGVVWDGHSREYRIIKRKK